MAKLSVLVSAFLEFQKAKTKLSYKKMGDRIGVSKIMIFHYINRPFRENTPDMPQRAHIMRPKTAEKILKPFNVTVKDLRTLHPLMYQNIDLGNNDKPKSPHP